MGQGLPWPGKSYNFLLMGVAWPINPPLQAPQMPGKSLKIAILRKIWHLHLYVASVNRPNRRVKAGPRETSLRKVLAIGLFVLCSSGGAFADEAAIQAANAARQIAQSAIPQERAELHGLRADLKAGTISKQAALALVQQIRAEIRAARHHN